MISSKPHTFDFFRSGSDGYLFSIGISCLFISLFLTTFYTSDNALNGAWVFLIGWLGFVVFQFSWYANPLNLLAFLFYSTRPLVALMLSFLALLLATQMFSFSEIPTGYAPGKIFIKELGFGAYIWYASQVVFFILFASGYIRSCIKKRGLSLVFSKS